MLTTKSPFGSGDWIKPLYAYETLEVGVRDVNRAAVFHGSPTILSAPVSTRLTERLREFGGQKERLSRPAIPNFDSLALGCGCPDLLPDSALGFPKSQLRNSVDEISKHQSYKGFTRFLRGTRREIPVFDFRKVSNLGRSVGGSGARIPAS